MVPTSNVYVSSSAIPFQCDPNIPSPGTHPTLIMAGARVSQGQCECLTLMVRFTKLRGCVACIYM